jgi:DNA-binding MarR family transcriptional regulator
MQAKYKSIKRLIDLWETYEEETEQQDLTEFADWLSVKLKQDRDLNVRQSKSKIRQDEPENLAIIRMLDEPERFLECTSRISRLHDYYIKKFFSDLPINNRLEYLFLYTVNQKREAKKTELINAHLVDYTTGMDTIKRLERNGLLAEMPDETDKRARLLAITDKGRTVLQQAGKRLNEEIHMYLACININKWKKALPLFEEINSIHSGIYMAHNDKSPAELMNLMDSLKHYYL